MSSSMVKSDPIVIGVVMADVDREKLGRVRVQLPHLENKPSEWARIATLMAGPNRGSFFKPEPGDEVLVALLHGDARRPYIIGALWNEKDTPPENGGTDANDLRVIRSRSGHILRFDDTSGGEKFEIIASGEGHRVVIDVSGAKIRIEADTGDIEVTAAAGSIKMSAAQNVEIEAGATMTLKAATVSVKGDSAVQIEGGVVMIN